MHLLLAKCFIPNPDNKPQINHIDGNKYNFSLDNLEWVTIAENAQHAFKNGLRNIDDQIKNKIGIFSDEFQNTDFRSKGGKKAGAISKLTGQCYAAQKAAAKARQSQIKCIDNNTIYNSLKEAGAALNINPRIIATAFYRGTHKCCGFTFERV